MATASKPGPSQKEEEKDKDDRTFECNICLDTAKDAVISLCGHLFCWPCLHLWLETRPSNQTCPVCKSAISKDNVIPLYGRGGTNQEDPREKVPPRPAGQRTESDNNGVFPGFGMGDGHIHMSFIFGALPLTLFSSTFYSGDQSPSEDGTETSQYNENNFLSKMFTILAVFIAFWFWPV